MRNGAVVQERDMLLTLVYGGGILVFLEPEREGRFSVAATDLILNFVIHHSSVR